jgi:hypothetical protein
MDLKGRITFDGWCLIYQRGSQRSSESQVKDRGSIPDKGTEFYKSHCLNRLRDFTQTCIKIGLLCDIWASHVCDYESYYIFGTNVVQSVTNLPTFRRNKLTSPSGREFPKTETNVLPKRWKFLPIYTALNRKIHTLRLILVISTQNGF